MNVGYLGDGTFWTQAEVKELVIYAKMRGVRVVPELEMSSHSKALLPLVKSRGLQVISRRVPHCVLWTVPWMPALCDVIWVLCPVCCAGLL